MSKAEELLSAVESRSVAASTDDILAVDLNTRVISIPASIKLLGVESDDDVKRLQFRVPRYYGEFDLSTFNFRINFANAKNKGDVYPVNDLATTGDDYITFSWLVDRTAFAYDGNVKFSVCMKLFDESGVVVKELNTTYATLPVLEGLETEAAVVENNPSAFDQVLFRLYAVETAMGMGETGYYSIVSTNETDEGVVFTIINSEGETTATVKNGKDGVTPINGVDYFTAVEKTEFEAGITENVKTSINNWTAYFAPEYSIIMLLASRWTSNTQTITVTGVNSDSVIFVSPNPAAGNYTAYVESGIRCISQADGSLTFQCEDVPTANLLVHVAIYYSIAGAENANTFTVSDDGLGNVTIS